ncbi:hypothetical protein AB4Z22_08795 [Paenibacillus sp. TAF58]
MKNKRIWAQSFLVFVTAAMVVTACSSKQTTTSTTAPVATTSVAATTAPAATTAAATASATVPEVKDITLVGVRDAQISSQQIIADKLGYFKETGLNVTSQLIESGPDIGPMVAGGSAPLSIQTNFMDIILKSSNVPVKIVTPLAQIAGTQAGRRRWRCSPARRCASRRRGCRAGGRRRRRAARERRTTTRRNSRRRRRPPSRSHW